MGIDKEKLQQEINSMRRSQKVFLILAIVFFAISSALAIAATVMAVQDIGGDIFFYLAQLSGSTLMVAITMLILRSVLFSYRINVRQAIIDGVIQVNEQGQYVQTVDVKPVPEEKELSREEELVKQYESLYKQGLISEEDFEKKRKEILGK